MGLSDDQRAMLRLLARREEGYEDIAALMGIGVDEVRTRVKEALAALDEGRPAAEGQTAPAAGPVAAGDPPPPAVAKASSGVVPPAAPPAEEKSEAKTTEPRPIRRSIPARQAAQSSVQMPLPKDGRRLVELVGGALLVILLVLFATGAVDIGGDDSSDGGTSTTATGVSSERRTTVAGDAKFTQAILEPVDGGDASGLARFGRIKNQVVLQVEAEGLDASPPGESYTVWLYRSPKLVLRVGAVRVTESGGIAAQFPIPTELLGVVANRAFDQIDVSLTSNSAYKAELARAKKQQRLPSYTGTSVLRGPIQGPIVR